MPEPICGYRNEPVCNPPDCSGACPITGIDSRPIDPRTELINTIARAVIIANEAGVSWRKIDVILLNAARLASEKK